MTGKGYDPDATNWLDEVDLFAAINHTSELQQHNHDRMESKTWSAAVSEKKLSLAQTLKQSNYYF